MASCEVLLELIIAVAAFEPFEQVLAVDVLNNWPLKHTGEALENSAARPIILVHVDNSVGLGDIVALNASRVLTCLLVRHHIHAANTTHWHLVVSRRGSPGDLIEIGLLLRHLVEVADQVGHLGSLRRLLLRLI